MALPKPTARLRLSGSSGAITAEEMRSMVCNPIYAGVRPFPAIVTDEQWVTAGARMIRKEGAEQFLVNLLAVLRATMETAIEDAGQA